MTEQEKEILYANVMKRANQRDTFGVENGMRIVAMGEGWARGELHTEVRHGNPMGIVHGGVYCTLLDQVGGAAACSPVAGTAACSRGALCRTVTCDVRFLAAGAVGGTLTSHAEAVRMGHSIVVMRAWVEDDGGTVCADGIYTFRMKAEK